MVSWSDRRAEHHPDAYLLIYPDYHSCMYVLYIWSSRRSSPPAITLFHYYRFATVILVAGATFIPTYSTAIYDYGIPAVLLVLLLHYITPLSSLPTPSPTTSWRLLAQTTFYASEYISAYAILLRASTLPTSSIPAEIFIIFIITSAAHLHTSDRHYCQTHSSPPTLDDVACNFRVGFPQAASDNVELAIFFGAPRSSTDKTIRPILLVIYANYTQEMHGC